MPYKSGKEIAKEVFDAVPDKRRKKLEDRANDPDQTVTTTVAFSPLSDDASIIETNEDKTEATMQSITASGLRDPSEKSIPELNTQFQIGSLNPLPADDSIANAVRANAYHERERSPKAKRVDENRQNNNTTNDYEEWKENPGRFDFPGVDTVDDGFRF